MKSKLLLTVMAIALLLMPAYLSAATVLDEADTIMGFDVVVYPFTANTGPFTYVATLTDLSDILEKLLPPGSNPGFESLELSVTDLAGNFLVTEVGPGNYPFKAVMGQKYLAWVEGDTGDGSRLGAFEVTIEAVPIPATLMLFGTGLAGLIAIRRRGRR